MKPALAPRRHRFERNAMSAAKRMVTTRRGALLALTHALAWLILAAAHLALGPAFALDALTKPTPPFTAPLPPARPEGPVGGRATIDLPSTPPISGPGNRGGKASAGAPGAAAKFAAGMPRADAHMRTGMAKDEGNGGSGEQNLARFRPDLPGEMSCQLLPAHDIGRGAMAAWTRCFLLPCGLAAAPCSEPIFFAGAARIWPPLRKPFGHPPE